MRILVTGASGLLGNNVTRLLLERGHEVRVLARKTSNQRSLAGLNVEIALGDMQDAESVRAAVDGVGEVIHCAGRVHIGWSGQELSWGVNVEGTRNVCAAALAAGARMVHVSSVDALGWGSPKSPANEESPPDRKCLNPYVLTKREAEQVVLQHVAAGLWAAIVNPGFMLGPWDWSPSSGRMLLQVAKGKGLFVPSGSNSFCDVRDVAAGAVAAGERGQSGRRYILAGETLTYVEAWRLFADVTGGRRPLVKLRLPMLTLIGAVGDLLTRITGRESDVNSAATAISTQSRNFTSARAAAELGYQTRPIRESAVDAWKWFQEHGYA